MTHPVRARLPHGSRGTLHHRRTRSLWTALLLVLGGAVLGWCMPRWEAHLPALGLSFQASTAQATLGAIAGGMITLAGFVVTAITLVVQTVQAMSPRLVAALGHFSRYLVLFGLLIGTALYALVALSQIRGEQVPRISVTLAVALVLFDAITVLYLLASLRHAVTGGGLARSVGDRLRTVIEQTYPEQIAASAPVRPLPDPSGGGVTVRHTGQPASVFAVSEPRLTRLAARHDLRVHLLRPVGDFVRTGTEMLVVESAGAAPSRWVVRRVAACVRYGPGRTVQQDAAYGFRLLADIAVRALSPAVNDPTTAVQAMEQIEDGLLRLSSRPLGTGWLLDRAGRPRVSYPAPRWPDFVSLALDETLVYGSSNPQTVRRLHALLDLLLAAVPEERRGPVADRRAALDRLAAAALTDPLLATVAAHPDRQGLGGVPPRETAGGFGPA